MTRDECFGVGLRVMAFDAAFRDAIFGPEAHNYQLWQQRIKAALDPNDVADSTFYV